MKRFFFFMALLVTLNTPFAQGSGHIEEIHSLKEIPLTNMKPGTVIFLDMDENVLVSAAGAPPVLKYLASAHEQCRLLEPDLAQTTHNMKTCIDGNASNVMIIGLTKRCMTYGDGRDDEADAVLEKAGIPLSRNRFQHLNGVNLCNNPCAGFRNGVIYTAGGMKSPYADEFFQIAKIVPSLIKFSDNLKENLIEMILYANKNGIPIDSYLMNRVHLLNSFIKGDKRDTRLPVNFDPDRYLHQHPDIFRVVADRTVSEQFSFAQQHYLIWGKSENRFLGYPDDFCPQKYLSLNQDIEQYALAHNLDRTAFAWSHYKDFGRMENRLFKKAP